MPIINDTSALSRPRTALKIRNRVVAEIVEVLIEESGSAHQDVVIDRIALRRGEPVTSRLAREVIETFEAHLKARRRSSAALLRRAFGEGSRRWTLEPHVYSIVERPAPMPAWPLLTQPAMAFAR